MAVDVLKQFIPGIKENGIVTDATVTLTGTVTLPASTAVGSASTLTAPVIAGGLTASGSASNDFSGSTGTFKTSTGAVTLGGNTSGAVAITSTSPTAGVGYATGAGLAVTQATNRTTGVTINAVTGAITLVSAAGSATPASFTVTNSAVAATDVVIVNQKSGTDLYEIFVTAVAAGSFRITSFTTGGTTTEQPVFNFAVIKGVAA